MTEEVPAKTTCKPPPPPPLNATDTLVFLHDGGFWNKKKILIWKTRWDKAVDNVVSLQDVPGQKIQIDIHKDRPELEF